MQTIDVDWAWQPFQASNEQPWTRELVAHLYRRAGFGADMASLDNAVKQSPSEIVSELLARSTTDSSFRSTADALTHTVLASGDPQRLSAAWVYRLLFTPTQLVEKAVLFWHGHFATSADKVQDANLLWQQNQVLREHALGDFGQLALVIAQDPAMLIYLDSSVNRKAHPNENFARELMELFCLGEGNYSEQDVRELARCFTGWEVKNKLFRKNRYQQDTGVKSLLGASGNFDGEDGVRVVLQQPHLEQFLARKWYRFFIADQPAPSAELLQPLADTFRRHDLQIAPAVQMILQSNLFYSSIALGQRIKSPVELVIGTLRSLKATTNTQLIAQGLRGIGQGLFYPPNVKGWDGGRAWINSSTLLGRSNLLAELLFHETTQFDGQSLGGYLESVGARSVEQVIAHFETCLFARPLDGHTRAQLVASVATHTGDKERRLRTLLLACTSLPLCQLG